RLVIAELKRMAQHEIEKGAWRLVVLESFLGVESLDRLLCRIDQPFDVVPRAVGGRGADSLALGERALVDHGPFQLVGASWKEHQEYVQRIVPLDAQSFQQSPGCLELIGMTGIDEINAL